VAVPPAASHIIICTARHDTKITPRWHKTHSHWPRAQRSVACAGMWSSAFIDWPSAARQWAFHAHDSPGCLPDFRKGNLPGGTMGARGILPSVPGL